MFFSPFNRWGIGMTLGSRAAGGGGAGMTNVAYNQNAFVAGSRYAIWTGMYNVSGLTHVTDFNSLASYSSATFPVGTRLYGFVPDPGTGAIRGYPQVWWGGYGGTMPNVATTPVQIRDMASFDADVDFTIPGGVGEFNVLDEFYLTTEHNVSASKIREIGWMRHTCPETIAWVADKTLIGVYTDEDGGEWNCYHAPGGSSGMYLLFHPANNLDLMTGSDRLRALKWLIQHGEISPNLWVRGMAVGAEPISGAWDVTITKFIAEMAGNVAVTNLVTQPDDLTHAFWTKSGSTASAADTIMETATTAGHVVYNSGMTRAAGIRKVTVWAEVEGIGRQYAKLQAFAGAFGAGYCAIVADLTATTAAPEAAAGGWAISNPFCVALPGSTKKRIGFDILTDGASTNLTVQIGPSAAANTVNYLGDVTKGLKISNIKVFDSTMAPRRMIAPTISGNDGTISVIRETIAGASGYKLRYSTDELTWTTVAQTTNPQTISGLTNGTLYYVQTCASNIAGDGEWSGSSTTVPAVLRTAKVRFGSNVAVAQYNSWAVAADSNIIGGTIANLLDTAGVATGWTITCTDDGPGIGSVGTTTGANTGYMPDEVMMSYAYTGIGAPAKYEITGLDNSKTYDLSMMPSRGGVGSRSTLYKVNGVSIGDIEAANNTTLHADVFGVSPVGGKITIDVQNGVAGTNGYINGLWIIQH